MIEAVTWAQQAGKSLIVSDLKLTVLKTGPDWLVRPVQPGTGSQSGPVNTPKTGQQPVKNRKTGQKPGKNRGWTGN